MLQVTQALDAKGRADKRARIKKSGERSGLQKLGIPMTQLSIEEEHGF